METEQEEEGEDNAEGDESVNVEKRHRSVERQFDPERQEWSGLLAFARSVIGAWEEFRTPMAKQEKPDGNRVEQSALGDKHRKTDAFPGDEIDSLIILP